MASRIQTAFNSASQSLLIPYLIAGWPQPAATVGLLHALERGGADLIELGVPFSDPSADGPVIQTASTQALAGGANLASTLQAAADYRASDGQLPLVLMGYANPFLRMGPANLAHQCQQCGIDGLLAVDWPPTKDDDLAEPLSTNSIDRIVLVAPTTSLQRARELSTLGSGYIYYVSIQGVTGSTKLDAAAVATAGAQLRTNVDLPVAVGFGVRTPADCAILGQAFDAVIVGTRLLTEISNAGTQAEQAATRLLAAMRAAMP